MSANVPANFTYIYFVTYRSVLLVFLAFSLKHFLQYRFTFLSNFNYIYYQYFIAMSLIWKWFTVGVVDSTKAICSICKAVVSRGGKTAKDFNTSNLESHLKKHSNEYHAYCELKSAKAKENAQSSCKYGNGTPTTAAATAQQVTLDHCFKKMSPLDNGSAKARDITNCIARMIAIDLQPYSVVENAGFKQLIKTLEPRYIMPGRKYFCATAIPGIYEQQKARLVEMLKTVSEYSLTSDL